jgi:hypothetical protein
MTAIEEGASMVKRHMTWRRCVVAWVAAWVVGGSAPAWAQSGAPCGERVLDTFEQVRLSRGALDDYVQVNGLMARDLAMLSTADLNFSLEHPLPVRTYAGPSAGIFGFSGMAPCGRGSPVRSSMMNYRLGIVAGVEDTTYGLSLRYVHTNYGSDMEVTPGAESGFLEGAETGQTTDAVRLQLTEWFALSVGRLRYTPTTISQLPDGADLEQLTTADASEHLFFRAEIPWLYTSFDFVLGDDREDVDTVYLDVNRLRLGAWPVEVNARLAYLDDEQRAYAVLGGDWVVEVAGAPEVVEVMNLDTEEMENLHALDFAEYRLGLEVAPEFAQPRLRYALARASARYVKYSAYMEDELAQAVMGASYFDAQASMYLSVFTGQLMREVMRQPRALGVGARGSVGVGFRMMSLNLDGFVGVNRPDTLTNLVYAADALELGLQLRWRVGF